MCVCVIVSIESLSECEINCTLCVMVCVMRSWILKPYCITTPLGSKGGSQLSHTETAEWLYIVRLRGGDIGAETHSKVQG